MQTAELYYLQIEEENDSWSWRSNPSGPALVMVLNLSFPSSDARTCLTRGGEIGQPNSIAGDFGAGTQQACVRGDDTRPWVLGARQVARAPSSSAGCASPSERRSQHGGLVDPPRARAVVYCMYSRCWKWRQGNRPIETNPSRQQLARACAARRVGVVHQISRTSIGAWARGPSRRRPDGRSCSGRVCSVVLHRSRDKISRII